MVTCVSRSSRVTNRYLGQKYACHYGQFLEKIPPFPEPLGSENPLETTNITFLGWHLVGVWIGGVWNGHFPESEKYFSETEISRKNPEIPQKERFFAKFQAPKFENPEPEKMQVPYPSHFLDLSTGYPNTYFSLFSGYPQLTLVFPFWRRKFSDIFLRCLSRKSGSEYQVRIKTLPS